MIKQTSKNTVKVCCGKKGCPQVEKLEDGMYKVTDDDGNTVLLKKEELKLMGDAVSTLDGDKELLLG